MNFNLEKNIESEIKEDEDSEIFEDSKLIREQEFGQELSPDQIKLNWQKLEELTLVDSKFIKKETDQKNKKLESKSKLQERIKNIRESLGI